MEITKELLAASAAAYRYRYYTSHSNYWQVNIVCADGRIVTPVGGRAFVPAIRLDLVVLDKPGWPVFLDIQIGEETVTTINFKGYRLPLWTAESGVRYVLLAPQRTEATPQEDEWSLEMGLYCDRLIQTLATQVYYPKGQIWPADIGMFYTIAEAIPLFKYNVRQTLTTLSLEELNILSLLVDGEYKRRR